MAQLPPLTYRVSKLWGQPNGTVEKHELDLPFDLPLDKNIVPAGNLKGNLMLIKLKQEISAVLSEVAIDISFLCQRCLRNFIQTITIPTAEREFFHEPPERELKLDDVFLIDTKAMTVDLSEMVRQEIILHFPFIPVCSKSCKGLCPVCGKDKNRQTCSCKPEQIDHYKPFQNLKSLVKGKKKKSS